MSRNRVIVAVAAVLVVCWVARKARREGAFGVSNRIVNGVDTVMQQQAPAWDSLPEHEKWLIPPPRARGWSPGLCMAITQDQHEAALRALGFPQAQARAASR